MPLKLLFHLLTYHMSDDFNNLGAFGWRCGLTLHTHHVLAKPHSRLLHIVILFLFKAEILYA